MFGSRAIAAAVLLLIAAPMSFAQSPRRAVVEGPRGTATLERWVRQLGDEIDHLQENLYYQRGDYSDQLRDRAEQASRAVAHFHRVLRRGADSDHLMRDLEEMDRQVHALIEQLNRSTDRWLRRQASRIRYADDQLHYVVQTTRAEGPGGWQDLVARHARLLEGEASQLGTIVQRGGREDHDVRDAVDDFVDRVEDFREDANRDAGADELWDEFEQVDQAWRRVVERLNRSSYSFYVRRRAQDVERVLGQLHGTLQSAAVPRRDVPVRRDPPRRGRPAVEFEIPGIGRFRIPR